MEHKYIYTLVGLAILGVLVIVILKFAVKPGDGGDGDDPNNYS